ncbi:SIR2 family protein [Bacillus cereus]|uniref:SIR2 family protein n=1 Tax=Bacillus cereus TaxID=1396 RepID=UPI000B4C1197|nr:SIR2 family protein [Bacillus cereus]
MITEEEFLKIPTLKRSLQDEKVIIFLGSGFSLDLGNPNWINLVIGIIEHIVTETGDESYLPFKDILKNGTMEVLDVLDVIEKKVQRRHIMDGLVKHIKEAVYSEKHKKLLNISRKLITTNYDRLLEHNSEIRHIFTYDNLYHISGIKEKDEFILKLHGCINDPDKCILFRKQYDGIYTEESAAILKMEGLIQDYTFLFVGFSFADPYVKDLFNKIDKILNGYGNTHYLITTEESEVINKCKYIQQIKIENWANIETLLDSLVTLKKKVKQERLESLFEVKGGIFEIDDKEANEFRDFIIEFHEKSPEFTPIEIKEEDKYSKFKKIRKKFEDMKCSGTMQRRFEKRFVVRFPLITEILNTETYIQSDKKELITDLIVAEFCKMDLATFKKGDHVFEKLIDNVQVLYESKVASIDSDRLRFYITIFVAWVINECDIFDDPLE